MREKPNRLSLMIFRQGYSRLECRGNYCEIPKKAPTSPKKKGRVGMIVGMVLVIAITVGLFLGLWPCRDGYTGMGVGNCDDIDECEYGYHDCHADATCTNTPGSWTCTCNEGYQQTGAICNDVDECATSIRYECHEKAVCLNLPSSYFCHCIPGT